MNGNATITTSNTSSLSFGHPPSGSDDMSIQDMAMLSALKMTPQVGSEGITSPHITQYSHSYPYYTNPIQTILLPSLCHRPTHTISLTSPHSHHLSHITPLTPSHSHHPTHTIPLTPSHSHHLIQMFLQLHGPQHTPSHSRTLSHAPSLASTFAYAFS